MITVEKLLKFVEFINSFQKIQRQILVKNEDRHENDLEHVGQLALVSWYFIASEDLNLDVEKVLKYSLAHDLVEVYSGDVYIFTKVQEEKDKKEEREHEALETIRKEFPEFADLHNYIEAYEQRKDDEAKFVYALDKVLPVINIYLDNGRQWRLNNVTLDMLKDNKTPKVKISKEVYDVWQEFVELLEKHKNLFPKD
ncbi:MAG TPA: HD domain-containing protein [Candidatus Dojkabacteria bacterium]|nr:HD domain-containing protein [Candidatus Dojkabacteria bacterium]